MNKVICIILSIVLIAGLCYVGNKEKEKSNREKAELEKKALEYEQTIPEYIEEQDKNKEQAKEVDPCRVVILVVDSLDEFKGELDLMFSVYGWEYKTDITGYDENLRTYGDYPVIGSCDMSIKTVITANVATGGNLCITIGKKNQRDRYDYDNVKNMLAYLNQYVSSGSMIIE